MDTELGKALGFSGIQILACMVFPRGRSPRLDQDSEWTWLLVPVERVVLVSLIIGQVVPSQVPIQFQNSMRSLTKSVVIIKIIVTYLGIIKKLDANVA